MSGELFEKASTLSETFMPAERAQSEAAMHAAKSLVAALEARAMPEFTNAASDAAMAALVRGITLTLEADTAMREAHRKFAKAVALTNLREIGWGCEGPECPEPVAVQKVEPLRAVA